MRKRVKSNNESRRVKTKFVDVVIPKINDLIPWFR